MRQRFSYSGSPWGEILAAFLVLAGCGAGDPGKTARTEASPQSGTPPTLAAGSPPAVPVPAAAPEAATAPAEVAAATQPQDIPATTTVGATDSSLYVCVTGTATAPQRTPIELSASVDKLCRKAPEMGPCQYEREVCRRRGGKVYTAAGVEITKQVEAEYDRRVMRVRMKSN